MQDKQVLFNN